MNCRIAVATSIPPKLSRENAGKRIDAEYQRICIRSLVECGFRVISVNSSEEIAALAPQFPEVHFVETARNASAWTGRKNPYIADLLLCLRDVPESVVGIVNSDLIFEGTPAWAECLASLGSSDRVVVGQRYDTQSLLNGTFRRFWPGFDYFFFARATANILAEQAMPFAMGLPFWDYWLPAAAAINGSDVRLLENLAVAHVMHAPGFSQASLAAFARFFSDFVVENADRKDGAVPGCISSIVPFCRSILSTPKGPTEEEYVLKQVNDIISRFVSAICARPIGFEEIRGTGPNWDLRVERSASEGLSIAEIFSDFRSRLLAGDALENARALALENRMAEAAAQYEIAVKKAPDDVEVLLAFGLFLLSRGNAVGAEKLTGRAVKLRPESAHGLNCHALALNSAGRRDEAIETFGKLLRVDPKFRDAYPWLAFLLFQARRPKDSLDLLDQALAMWPDFAEAGNLRDQITKASGFN